MAFQRGAVVFEGLCGESAFCPGLGEVDMDERWFFFLLLCQREERLQSGNLGGGVIGLPRNPGLQPQDGRSARSLGGEVR